MPEAGATHVDTATKLARAQEHIRGTNVSIGTPYLGSIAPPVAVTPSILSPMARSVGLVRCGVVGKLSGAVSELLGPPASARR
jgi:hypothetical protein